MVGRNKNSLYVKLISRFFRICYVDFVSVSLFSIYIWLKKSLFLCLDATGIPLTKESRQSKCIVLTVGTVDVPGVSGPRRQQAYSLQVDQKKEVVLLKGESETGIFYGIQTLLSLGDDTLTHLPVARISDAPRYAMSGFSQQLTFPLVAMLTFSMITRKRDHQKF